MWFGVQLSILLMILYFQNYSPTSQHDQEILQEIRNAKNNLNLDKFCHEVQKELSGDKVSGQTGLNLLLFFQIFSMYLLTTLIS